MKPIPDCVPDALTMILAAARAVSDEDFIHRKVLFKVLGEIADDGDLGSSPADFYFRCWETACKALGVKDPFENEKARGDKTALGILKTLGDGRDRPADVLTPCVKLSFVGAMIDFTGLGRADIEEKTRHYYDAKPGRDDSQALVAALVKAESVLMVADRAGEIAMDRPLAEMLAEAGKSVTVAVATKPVYSMATAKDAVNSGYSKTIRVADPGTAMYGLVQEKASSEFQDVFERADVVIVKGDTHFETLTVKRPMFFILRAESRRSAEKLGMPAGSGAIALVEAGGLAETEG